MPKVGDMIRGNELGYKNNKMHIYHACEGCGKKRWVQFRNGNPKNKYCVSCAGSSKAAAMKNKTEDKAEKENKTYPDVSVLDSFFDSISGLKSKIKELESEVEFYKGKCQKWTKQIGELQNS